MVIKQETCASHTTLHASKIALGRRATARNSFALTLLRCSLCHIPVHAGAVSDSLMTCSVLDNGDPAFLSTHTFSHVWSQ